MKAKAGFLMLLIGMMCFTGFGNTTTDLTDNSTDLTLVDCHDVELNVVLVTTFEFAHNVTAFREAGFEVIYSAAQGTDEALSFITTTQSEQNLNFTYKHSGDVGWQNMNENYNYNYSSLYTASLTRNPRDGLQKNLPFSYL